MTHGLKMSKLFAKANYQSAESIKPFWLKASEIPLHDDITLITVITPDTWTELERLVDYWKGPISATLHTNKDENTMTTLREKYNNHAELLKRVDIHLSESPQAGISVLVPRNAERNVARLFAQTEYVMEMPSNMVPATDLRRTLNTNKGMFENLLRDGDVLVVPTFGFPEQESTVYKLPFSKSRLLELVDDDNMFLLDKHWKPNTGPTDLDLWKTATTLYPVSRYDFHYEPIVIESKTIQPWCAERFLDSRPACLFSTYLSGGDFWVLPDDYVVELPETEKNNLSDFDHVIENRLYAKFYWEQCVHHARQLDALGLWKGKRSEHIRTQCSRVIQNWGKGLIGKPE
ncbi:uncharacterized protein BX664DRAFT_364963 [Halteromyces radiatus]|uniref:uncharacterized protein n=1 Tax=Halteromyces radiatus TaxID=101107 RepID=UPI0022204010|nr:uncharacterized protein BX664DRAFT_364963 [Halteromyces radiatus]KAI8093470.1 hypothetical protein BX664DRAFT_364963 [Halteromyces radiatus]